MTVHHKINVLPKNCTVSVAVSFLLVVVICPQAHSAFVGFPTDPALVNVAIGIVSAAAGAVSQVPQIKKLQHQLDSEKKVLDKTKQAMNVEVSELADKLYFMDEEFEQQTLELKDSYNTKLEEELQKTTEKLKQDYKFTYGIQLYQEKQKYEMEKLQFLGNINGPKDIELVQLRLKRNQLERRIDKLEKTLFMQQQELEEFQQRAVQRGNNSSTWWSL